ncbi:low-specificity L-threonine aldolase [Alphaproteobacteria bacterium]|jgi:threonine aldolase|nr:low-specificity L-threonine aldolase [Alphaproteobacteria bacterium]MDC0394580.1 low-specificity L-threonine aldolase [Alphaproteobacteria bacterium]MDC0461729.1 low-specificity L-threonine aldolase [Alphaproteobacteria bacterium]
MQKYFSDFRSDTVSKPSLAMREAMRMADVGDDDYGDDPTVKELEEKMAALLGKPSALFLPSGTQSNLIAILTHCQRGEELITGKGYHVYAWEGGGASALGGVVVNPLMTDERGSINLDELKISIKTGSGHEPPSKLLSLENTYCGMVQPIEALKMLTQIAREHNLSTHLDGARLANAVAKTNNSFAEYGSMFDSISICLSKGLGAPVGSVLVGGPNFIDRARRQRKQLGGGMRQSGILAAAALYAIENNVSRLSEDHQNAIYLAQELEKNSLFQVRNNLIDTNIVYADIQPDIADAMHLHISSNQLKVNFPEPVIINDKIWFRFRFVMHLDINKEDIEKLTASINSFEC